MHCEKSEKKWPLGISVDQRARFRRLVDSDRFQMLVLVLVIINTVTLGLETFDFQEDVMSVLLTIDNVILALFLVELALRLYGHGIAFFSDGWNTFDFLIILASALPSAGILSVVRVFRVLRMLRLISLVPSLQLMVETTIRSLRGVVAISSLLMLVIYTSAVMAHMLFADGSDLGEAYFGTLWDSMFSLFQVMTLDSWSEGLVRELIDLHGWPAAVFFGTFIVITSFTFLNMFIAVFTTSMAALDIEDGDDVGFSGMLNELRSELHELKALVASSNVENEPDDSSE